MNSSIPRKECEASSMLLRLIVFQDFEHDPNNPFYRTYTSVKNNTANMTIKEISYDTKSLAKINFPIVFFTICYAYSIFRIFINVTKIIYSDKKMKIIFRDEKNKEMLNEKIDGKETPRVYEIKFYKFLIYFNVWIDLILSLQNFITWRGVQYFESFQIYSNINESSEKDDRSLNCLFDKHLINFESNNNDKNYYFISMIVIWIIFDCSRMFISYISVLTLSRINRKEKSGKDFLRPNIFKALMLVSVYFVILLLFIFLFDIPLFYRFYMMEVLCFWFFWKTLGFFLLFDRLHSKFWLFQNLKFQSLHSHGIEWRKKLGYVKNTIIENEGNEENFNLLKKMERYLEKDRKEGLIDESTYEKVQSLFRDQGEEIRNIYTNHIDKFYKENIENEIIVRYEEEKKSKLKTKWADYLNFILGLNLLGIIGYLFLILDFSIMNRKVKTDHLRPTFYIGTAFCFLEIIIDDLSHGIFLLHSFFIELFEFLKENRKPNESFLRLGQFDGESYEIHNSSIIEQKELA